MDNESNPCNARKNHTPLSYTKDIYSKCTLNFKSCSLGVKCWSAILKLKLKSFPQNILAVLTLGQYERWNWERCWSAMSSTRLIGISFELRAKTSAITRINRLSSWEPEGCNHHRLFTKIAPFWFSMEHLSISIAPFRLSTYDVIPQITSLLHKIHSIVMIQIL